MSGFFDFTRRWGLKILRRAGYAGLRPQCAMKVMTLVP